MNSTSTSLERRMAVKKTRDELQNWLDIKKKADAEIYRLTTDKETKYKYARLLKNEIDCRVSNKYPNYSFLRST